MPQVSCSVANCTYWAQGNKCSAEAIMVEIDAHGNYKEEFAGEYGQHNEHQDKAANSSQTCCLTFKPKQTEKK